MRRGALFIREAAIVWDEVPRDSYLRDIPALKGFDRLAFDSNVTFFAGENGTGKSTLLEGIAVAYGYNPEGGTRNYHFSTYHDVSELEEAIRLVRGYRKRNSGYFFRAESFFNVATVTNLEYNDGSMPDYHAQSHGESFLAFLQDECREGVYLMDEPEAALSPQRQLTLLLHIHCMALEGSQFIIATHSPILLGLPGGANTELLRGRHPARIIRGHGELPDHEAVSGAARAAAEGAVPERGGGWVSIA